MMSTISSKQCQDPKPNRANLLFLLIIPLNCGHESSHLRKGGWQDQVSGNGSRSRPTRFYVPWVERRRLAPAGLNRVTGQIVEAAEGTTLSPVRAPATARRKSSAAATAGSGRAWWYLWISRSIHPRRGLLARWCVSEVSHPVIARRAACGNSLCARLTQPIAIVQLKVQPQILHHPKQTLQVPRRE